MTLGKAHGGQIDSADRHQGMGFTSETCRSRFRCCFLRKMQHYGLEHYYFRKKGGVALCQT